jgi:hypothetical protein
MRSVKPCMSQEALKMVYYAYFHSIMSYGSVLSGNFSIVQKYLQHRVQLELLQYS